jgi:hypothetical protein
LGRASSILKRTDTTVAVAADVARGVHVSSALFKPDGA